MAMPTNAALPPARGEPRTRIALLLESVALRHQIGRSSGEPYARASSGFEGGTRRRSRRIGPETGLVYKAEGGGAEDLHPASGPNGRSEFANRDFGRERRFTCRKMGFSATTYLQMRALWRAFR